MRQPADPGLIGLDAEAATLAAWLLPGVLSLIAGSTDTIGFLQLNGLFTAQITGNLVSLAAHLLAGTPAPTGHLLAVPTFVAALAATRVGALALEATGLAALPCLLGLEALLLGGVTALGVLAGRAPHPDAPILIAVAVLTIAAMAAQNALGRLCLSRAPSTPVMTTNVTQLTLDLVASWLARDPARRGDARASVRRIAPVVVGFLTGCTLGAGGAATIGLPAMVLPAVLALIACAMTVPARRPAAARL